MIEKFIPEAEDLEETMDLEDRFIELLKNDVVISEELKKIAKIMNTKYLRSEAEETCQIG